MQENKGGFVVQLIRGVVVATLITLILIILFALVLSFALISDGGIKAVNGLIKTLSLFIACFLSVKDLGGLLKGALIGVIFSVAINCLFALFGGTAVLNAGFVIDLLFCGVIGAIAGVFAVNFTKNK